MCVLSCDSVWWPQLRGSSQLWDFYRASQTVVKSLQGSLTPDCPVSVMWETVGSAFPLRCPLPPP